VVEAALTGGTAMRPAARWRTPLAVIVLLVLLLALVISGQWPELRSKPLFSPKGLLGIAPNEIERIGIRSGTDGVALRRQPGGWTIDGMDGAAPADLVSHVDTALKFLKVSEPSREIPAGELAAESFAAFGLDPPTEVAVLETHSAIAATVNFGTINPAGTSHYVRLGGAAAVYLMPRHVTEEWRLVFDMVRRLRGKASFAVAGRGADLLLPVSMAQVWAIEIVASGKLTRFERDAEGSGSNTSVSTRTRPVAMFMSPIPSRHRSSMPPSAPSMRPRRKSASGLPMRRVSLSTVSRCRH
jgi:hypothetical protein